MQCISCYEWTDLRDLVFIVACFWSGIICIGNEGVGGENCLSDQTMVFAPLMVLLGSGKTRDLDCENTEVTIVYL